MEDIDALPHELVRLAGQEAFDAAERLDARPIKIIDLEINRIAHDHVDRHVLDHVLQLTDVPVRLDLFGHDIPGQHRADIIALIIQDRCHQKIEIFVAELNDCRMRQILRVGQQLALVFRVLVEDIDALPHELVRLAGQEMLELLQGPDTGGVGIDDPKIIQVAHDHIDRHAIDHLLKAIALSPQIRWLGAGLRNVLQAFLLPLCLTRDIRARFHFQHFCFPQLGDGPGARRRMRLKPAPVGRSGPSEPRLRSNVGQSVRDFP